MKELTVKRWLNGDVEWLFEGKLHREDGPAIERRDGYKAWYVDGKLHREGGPAIEYIDGHEEWYVDGKLHREGGPAIEWNGGLELWYQHGKLHREDGPAIEFSVDNKERCLGSQFRCVDGRDVEWASGHKGWFLNGIKVEEKG